MPYAELDMVELSQDPDDDLDSEEQMSTQSGDSDEFVDSAVKIGKVSAGTCSLVALLVAVVSLTAFCMQNRIRAPAVVVPDRNDGQISARQLFESKELADVATENTLAMASSGNQTLDRRAVHASMVGGLGRVKDMLEREMPAEYARLGELMLTRHEQQAVLSAMRRVTDLRVQQLGKEVVTTLGAKDSRNAHQRLLEYLRAKHENIRNLREDIFASLPMPQNNNMRPEDVSANLTSSGLLLLDPGRMHIMRQVNGWNATVEATWPKARRLQAEASGLAQDPSAAHQAKWFFDLMKGFADRVGLDFEKIAKAMEKVDFGELLTCVLSKLAAMRFQQLAGCASQLAAVAMEIFKLFSDSFNGKKLTGGGKVVTATDNQQERL